MAKHVEHLTAEVAKSLDEIEKDWEISAKESKNGNKAGMEAFVAGITDQSILVRGSQAQVHRVFMKTPDSGEYTRLGWILNSEVDCCMICTNSLNSGGVSGFFDWSSGAKLHCYGCGNIVCQSCCSTLAVVREISALGEVPVCSQCYFGQEEVKMLSLPQPVSYKMYQKLQAAKMGQSPMTDGSSAAVSPTAGGRPEPQLPRIWKYGNVKMETITPSFQFSARTKEKVLVYVNVCSHPQVPFNLNLDQQTKRSSPLCRKGQELMIAVGEKGVSNQDRQAVVYDTVVHPTVLNQALSDATGVLKEKLCGEILRSIRRLGIEAEFLLFTYLPKHVGPYHHRHREGFEYTTWKEDLEVWKKNEKARMAPLRGSQRDIYSDLDEEEAIQEKILREGNPIFIPLPSIAAFFHMEQIHVVRNDANMPAIPRGDALEKRWVKYIDITQRPDGTCSIPNNKRAKKIPPAVPNVSAFPQFVSDVVSTKQKDRYGNPLVTYSAILVPQNGFIISAARKQAQRATESGADEVEIHVLHHSFVDDFARCGLVSEPQDEVDPLLFVCKKSQKIRRERDSQLCRTYYVAIGSSYIAGVDDLTGRRIVAPERLQKIIRRVSVLFDDALSLTQYSLHGIDHRPLTDPMGSTAFIYERPLYGSVDEQPPTQGGNTKRAAFVPALAPVTIPATSPHVESALSTSNDSHHLLNASRGSTPRSVTAGAGTGAAVSPMGTGATTSPFGTGATVTPSNGSVDGDSKDHKKSSKGVKKFFFGGKEASPSHAQQVAAAQLAAASLDQAESESTSDVTTTAANRKSGGGWFKALGSKSRDSTGKGGIAAVGEGVETGSYVGEAERTSLPISPRAGALAGLIRHSSSADLEENGVNSQTPTPTAADGRRPVSFGGLGRQSSTTLFARTVSTDPSMDPATTPRVSVGRPGASPTARAGAPAPLARQATVILKKSGTKPESVPGAKLITPDMLEYIVYSSVNRAVAEAVSRNSVSDPKILFGWQVRILEHASQPNGGLYVITGTNRTVIGLWEFRLTTLTDDVWTKLKRGGKGDGLAFTVIRKVITLED